MDDSSAVASVALSEPLAAVLFATPFLAVAGALVASHRPDDMALMFLAVIVIGCVLVAVVRPAGNSLPSAAAVS